MPNLQLDWQQSAVLTAVLVVAAVAASMSGARTRVRAALPYLRESALIAGLYSLWQLAGSISVFGTSGALDRGRWLLRIEHAIGLPREQRVQALIEHRSVLAQLCNLYYASMHFTGLGVFLLWLFVRHRDRYPQVRWVLALLTVICLLIQLIPVAPPRLLPELGFVDTAALYHQSVYQIDGITVDSLSAMPSVHVGWALLIAWAVIAVSTSRYRWWVLAHPILTIFVVTATANHYWADGIVAAGLLALSIGLVALGYRIVGRSRSMTVPTSNEPAYR